MVGKNKGFHRPALEAWVEACKRMDNPHKKVVGLLLAFTGVRNNVIGHIHGPTWFTWTDPDSNETNDGEAPKLKVKNHTTCYRNGSSTPCSNCEEDGEFTTKYNDARKIPLIVEWRNWNKGDAHEWELEPLDVRGIVKDYFAVTPDDYGHKMIGPDGTGISNSTVNVWCKEIAQEAQIGLERGTQQHSSFDDPVPKVDPHDLRGTFIMQLIRNNMQRTKIIKYTGHEHVSSLEPYEERVSQETSAREFLDHI